VRAHHTCFEGQIQRRGWLKFAVVEGHQGTRKKAPRTRSIGPSFRKIKTGTEISHWKTEAEETVDAGKDCERSSCVEMFLASARKHSEHRVE